MLKFKNVKIILNSLTIVFLLFHQTYAQEKNTVPNKWALQFQITENFSLSSFQGNTISLLRNYSPTSAIRFGVSINGQTSNTNFEVAKTGLRTLKENEFSLISNLYYIKRITNSQRSKIFPYFGIGPQIRYGYQYHKQINKTENGNSIFLKEDNILGIGFSGVFGTELFINRNISLLVEYSTSFLYNKIKSDNKSKQKFNTMNDYITTDDRITDKDSYSINPSSVKFGLSVYF